jgi:hypothetical protein
LFCSALAQEFSVGRDHVDGAHVIAGESEAAAETAETAAERESAHARVRHRAGRGCQPVSQRFAIERT